MISSNFFKHTLFTCLLGGILLFIYWSGLYGDYVFDDISNIVENKNIKLNEINIENLKLAALSGDSGPLGRSMSYLSFAFNYYFTEFNPFYFKLTNLIIHFFNAVLVYAISINLFKFKKVKDYVFLSFLVALFWSVLPINLTSVLYVVQRMTSLSAFFGFIAILLYVCWRLKSEVVSGLKSLIYFSTIATFLAFSILSKESGLLFMSLIFLIEIFWFEGKDSKSNNLKIFNLRIDRLYWILIIIGLFIIILNIGPHISTDAYMRRNFTLNERLLTEVRVIFYYLKLIFLPSLSELSLYHDDFIISKSFLNPISTSYAIIIFISINLLVIFSIKKTKIFAFAWFWYLISHALESTIFSLELVHEHRNYFASLGLIITIFYFISKLQKKQFLYAVMCVYICFIALVTKARAEIWSNLVDHAQAEAYYHPKSDRANYQLARIYLKLWQLNYEQRYIDLAKLSLMRARNSYEPELGAWFAELHVASALEENINIEIKNQLIQLLRKKPFYNSTFGFLRAFSRCQTNLECKLSDLDALEIMSAALHNDTLSPPLRAGIYQMIAIYYVEKLGDIDKSISLMNMAINIYPDSSYYFTLAQLYEVQKNYALAIECLSKAKKYDQKGLMTRDILEYELIIKDKMM